MTPKKETLAKSISATTENAKKLLDDAIFVFDWDRYSTALALAVLAQEEFAKAFLLQLVDDGALPWRPEVRRSITRHQCKHLLALVMEWVPPFDMEEMVELHRRDMARHEQRMAWSRRCIERYQRGLLQPDPDDPEPQEPDVAFPPDVADALNIYRHEEIERMRSGSAWRDEDWAPGKARKIADGVLDRKKQSALYVDISKTGEVGLHPGLITREDAVEAIERAKRFVEGPGTFSDEYKTLKKVLIAIFAGLSESSADT
jgi:AbiV family abortive infection protein